MQAGLGKEFDRNFLRAFFLGAAGPLGRRTVQGESQKCGRPFSDTLWQNSIFD